jgi:hypothetical protein
MLGPATAQATTRMKTTTPRDEIRTAETRGLHSLCTSEGGQWWTMELLNTSSLHFYLSLTSLFLNYLTIKKINGVSTLKCARRFIPILFMANDRHAYNFGRPSFVSRRWWLASDSRRRPPSSIHRLSDRLRLFAPNERGWVIHVLASVWCNHWAPSY